MYPSSIPHSGNLLPLFPPHVEPETQVPHILLITNCLLSWQRERTFMLTRSGPGFWLSRLETKVGMLARVEKFLHVLLLVKT